MNETRNLAIKDLLEAIELVDRAYEKIHKVSNTITVNEAHNPSTININIEGLMCKL